MDFVVGLLRGLTRSGRRAKNRNSSAIRRIRLKKVIVAKGQGNPFYAEEGFLRVSLLDFYLNENSSDW